MWLRDLFFLIPPGAGTTMAWQNGWLAEPVFFAAALIISWLFWEIRRAKGFSALVKDELIPAVDHLGELLTRGLRRRGERRELKARQRRRLRKLQEGDD